MSDRKPLPPHPRSGRGFGFTVVELITVLALVGVLSAVVMPRLVNPQSYRDLLLKDQLIMMSRFAQQSALSRFGQRVCLEISLQAGSPAQWLFEVWAGDDTPALPAAQCVKTTLLKQQRHGQGGSTLSLNGTPVDATPITLRFDNLGYLVAQSTNLSFTASGRNVCITRGGFAYSAVDGATCAAN